MGYYGLLIKINNGDKRDDRDDRDDSEVEYHRNLSVVPVVPALSLIAKFTFQFSLPSL